MINEHPIEGLMVTAMNSIQDMIDVNTIIGEPIAISNIITIIPISKVSFGFAAGGSEFTGKTMDKYTKKDREEEMQYRLPFGGGSGAGVSISPVAFLIVQPNNVKLLPVCHLSAVDRLLDYVPDLMEKMNNYLNKTMQNKKEDRKEEIKKQEKDKKEEKEIIENIQSTVQNLNNKIRPRRAKQQKAQPQQYEFEYDEVDREDYDDENEIIE